MMTRSRNELESDQEAVVESDKVTYEIFSILESKFLFGYEEHKLGIPRQLSASVMEATSGPSSIMNADGGVSGGKNHRGKICVLCIDGGGMRNILSGKALAYLEDALRRKSGKSNARIADFFDVAAGAGFGGIFTAMLFGTKDRSSPISEATDTWKFLATQGKNFYKLSSSGSGSARNILRRILGLSSIDQSSKSVSSELDKVLRELFNDGSRSLTLKDTLKPVLIPCYDLTSSAPFLFSRADALETDGYNFKLWEVCRATSAQPSLFQPVSLKSVDGKTNCLAIDGGLAMNNPTSAAITHVIHNKQEFPFVRGVEDLLVLSLGTGQLLEASYDCDQVKRWKAKHWAHPMARISGDSSSDIVDHAVSMAFGQNRCNYVRIQANGSRLGGCGPNLDYDASPSNVKKLIDIADEMLKQKSVESVLFGGKRISEQSNLEKLDWFVDQLILEHHRRSCS